MSDDNLRSKTQSAWLEKTKKIQSGELTDERKKKRDPVMEHFKTPEKEAKHLAQRKDGLKRRIEEARSEEPKKSTAERWAEKTGQKKAESANNNQMTKEEWDKLVLDKMQELDINDRDYAVLEIEKEARSLEEKATPGRSGPKR